MEVWIGVLGAEGADGRGEGECDGVGAGVLLVVCVGWEGVYEG